MWKHFSLNIHSVSFVITEDFPRLSLSVSVVNSDVEREILPHSVSVVITEGSARFSKLNLRVKVLPNLQ
jgi:hypothetical protein